MKKNEAKLFIKTPPEPVQVKLHKATLERRSQRIWNYLEKHPWIAISRMTEAIEYSAGNFDKYRKGRKTLPQHLLLKIETALKDYGLIAP